MTGQGELDRIKQFVMRAGFLIVPKASPGAARVHLQGKLKRFQVGIAMVRADVAMVARGRRRPRTGIQTFTRKSAAGGPAEALSGHQDRARSVPFEAWSGGVWVRGRLIWNAI